MRARIRNKRYVVWCFLEDLILDLILQIVLTALSDSPPRKRCFVNYRLLQSLLMN